MVHLLLLAALTLTAQASDTSLTSLVSHLRETELRSGGWRDTMTWQPADSATARFLRATGVGAHDTILPIESASLRCPGSTDQTGAPRTQPVGYTLRVQIESRGSDSATVEIVVACQYYQHDGVRGFQQGKRWEAVKGADGWHAVLRKVWVT